MSLPFFYRTTSTSRAFLSSYRSTTKISNQNFQSTAKSRLITIPIANITKPCHRSFSVRPIKSTPTTHPHSNRRLWPVLVSILGLSGLGWAIDKYVYAEALGRTLRLAYNAGIIILDYKLNFSPDSSPDALHERVSERISKTCIKNGGLYIKLGQSIAIQAAILPAPYRKAFETMFDSASPLPFDEILKVWNQEFGCDLSDRFDQFDTQPIACGSIAQVHRARLKTTGQEVAVKVQRPDIPIQMELDLFAYRSLLYIYQRVFDLPVYFIANYVSDQIRKETDFIREGQNSERTAKFLEADPMLKEKVYVPKVHWPLTTKRILTTELINDGCRLTEEGKIDHKGLKKKDVMDLAMKLFSQMLFNYGWLHCDLHPGNVLVLERRGKPKLVLLDHGLYIQLPDQFRREYCELWRSLFVLDTQSIGRIAKGWGIANSELFASATLLRPFKMGKSKRNQNATGGAKAPAEDMPMSGYESSLKIKETMKTILENEALIPQELIFIVRCMRMMQGNNQFLGSPSNRINILAHGAAAGMDINAPPPSSLPSGSGLARVLKAWLDNLIKVWTFRAALIVVDVGFFVTQVRQWWLRDVRRHKRGEGFEDLLQRQLETFAKEEFGVTLDDTAFMG